MRLTKNDGRPSLAGENTENLKGMLKDNQGFQKLKKERPWQTDENLVTEQTLSELKAKGDTKTIKKLQDEDKRYEENRRKWKD